MSEPTIEERLRKLPLRSLIAFAARRARRVQPLFDRVSPIPDFLRHRNAIERAIRLAELFASGSVFAAAPAPGTLAAVGRRGIQFVDVRADEVAEYAVRATAAARADSVAATAARAAAAAAATAARADAAARGIEFVDARPAVERAAGPLFNAALLIAERADAAAAFGAIGNDLRNLEALTASRPKKKQTDKSEELFGDPVDPSEAGPLGPLWPDGAPEWFTSWGHGTGSVTGIAPLALLSNAAARHDHPSLKVYVDAGAADQETIRDLFLALSAVYEAQGGSGLKVVEHRQRTLVGEEVPV